MRAGGVGVEDGTEARVGAGGAGGGRGEGVAGAGERWGDEGGRASEEGEWSEEWCFEMGCCCEEA